MHTWFARTRTIALDLTRFFSQTDTDSEGAFGPFLEGWLRQWPAFQAHPEWVRLLPTQDDPRSRSVVMALARGRGRRTLILTGHYDVVGIENYADLAPWACDPPALLPRLIQSLQAQPDLSPADQSLLDDLTSGDFLPGRGLLDMKGGLAAGLAVMEQFFTQEDAPGNLLFLAVPDEEIASHGARTAALGLSSLAAEFDLELVGAVNLDASDDPGDGSLGRSIYLGSIGKLLPAVYWVGRETHAGSPFSGVNAALLASELTRRLEWAPDLIETRAGEWTVPPVCLKQADTKTHYDVTTPTAAWAYYNWLTLNRSASEVLTLFTQGVRQALGEVLRQLDRAALDYTSRTGRQVPRPDFSPLVLSYAQLMAEAERRSPGFAARQAELEQTLAADAALDAPECALRLVQAAWEASALLGPAAVVLFAALHYPPVFINSDSPNGHALLQALHAAVAHVEAEQGVTVSLRPFFPGISDVSFFGGRVPSAALQALAENSPCWNSRAGFDLASTSALDLPSVNIGPWGRDYHQRGERMHQSYGFELLPELLWQVQTRLLRIG